MGTTTQWSTRFADLDKDSVPVIAFRRAMTSDTGAAGVILAQYSTGVCLITVWLMIECCPLLDVHMRNCLPACCDHTPGTAELYRL
jgi:hypothetical protein